MTPRQRWWWMSALYLASGTVLYGVGGLWLVLGVILFALAFAVEHDL